MNIFCRVNDYINIGLMLSQDLVDPEDTASLRKKHMKLGLAPEMIPCCDTEFAQKAFR